MSNQTGDRSWTYCALPYLLAVCIPLAIVAANPEDIPAFSSICRTLVRLLAATALAHVVLRLLRVRTPARELILCAAQLHLVAYGFIYQGLLGGAVMHRFLLPAWSVIILLAVYLIWRLKQDTAVRMASAIRLGVIVLLLLQLVRLVPLIGTTKTQPPTDSPIVLNDVPEKLPDIYYVILDAYGREDVLAELYGLDNSKFLSELKARDFWVGQKTRSNYQYTRRSLPSSLNMTYLNDVDPSLFATREFAHRMINQGLVIDTLNRAGYNTVALADGFPPIENSKFDQYLTESYATSELDNALLGSTWILPLLEAVRRSSPFDSARKRLHLRLSALGNLGRDADDPLFVFAHILSPHRPFLFDADGNHLGYPESFWSGASYDDPTPQTREMYIRGYNGQLKYLNQQVLKVIDTIQARDRDSIIILQGDHGPGGYMRDPSERQKHLRERFSILLAIHGPTTLREKLYDTLTPVNLFRIVLSDSLNTELPVFPDRSYFENRETKRVDDVTDLVSGSKTAEPVNLQSE